jgi:hypothetical protein
MASEGFDATFTDLIKSFLAMRSGGGATSSFDLLKRGALS